MKLMSVWLINKSVIELVTNILLSTKSCDRDLPKGITHDRVNGTSFYSENRAQLNGLHNISNNCAVNLSPRPQTPPTNLYSAKNPRSPRRTSSSVDYKKVRTHMVKGLVNAEDANASFSNLAVPKETTRVNAKVNLISVTVEQNKKSLSPKEIVSIPRFYFSKGKPANNKDNETMLNIIHDKLKKLVSHHS